MSLLVLGYPNLSPDDFEWIQSMRARYDKLYYDVVPPHFTIVFPVTNVDEQKFKAHIKEHAQWLEYVSFVLRCAVVVKDSASKYTHVFLVPDEGYSGIVKLHDRLYTGVLASELRLDLPFVPHIGVCNSVDPNICKKLAGDLNASNFEIAGDIDELNIVNYEGANVTTIEKISLGRPRERRY